MAENTRHPPQPEADRRAGSSSSLALRLFLSAAVVTSLVLLATGIGLSSLYSGALERAFDRRLAIYLKALVAAVAVSESGAEDGDLGEPLFDLPLSGWYWQVVRVDSSPAEVRASRSLFGSTLLRLDQRAVPEDADGIRHGYVAGPGEQPLRLAERTIDLGEDGRLLVAVGGDAREIVEESAGFNLAIGTTFAGLGLLLVLTTLFQVGYGLRPLQALSKGLAAIRAGTADRLEGPFPREVAPLAREMNALVAANREVVERARTHVGNLAHALKTPLSVLLNEAAGRDDALAAKVREQVAVMREQVGHHLDRARIAAAAAHVASLTEVAPAIAALVRTLEKIHAGRGLTFATALDPDLKFRGERHDLDEMIGNLIDNAAKWASSRVEIEVLAEPAAHALDRRFLRVVIDDDGPGLTADQREAVAKRGKRLDETKPGSGFGLAIAVETATEYGGRLVLGAAPIGGLRAELILPAG
ncbi:ATP-binding protein [Blastochloris viridis]|uniref:histidine kinase n=1 Tax=Blastochloris viridis TaxID=1079 RepID=A0A182D3H6_BLAVI|nr:ATP-binding protein [Blastochloris viridis]ALK10107.1 Sensor protein PhoQ [Blastochloris viridis]BAR99965.1 sensor histidine kinase [Blastochloris viridis]